VKGLDALPVDPILHDEGIEHLRLRRGRGEDDPSTRAYRKDRPEALRGVRRRRLRHCSAFGQNEGPEATATQLDHACSGTKTTKKT
jgi:hypothetical protein